MQDQGQIVVKSALIITVIAAVSRVMGFLRETVMAYIFGVGAVMDAYAVAMRVVGTAGLVVGIYLTTVFIPSYVRARENKGDKIALWVANNALGASLIINIVLMIILQITAPVIIRGLTGFDAELDALAITAANIVLFQLPMITFVHFFVGYLTARKSFIGPNAIGIPMNIVFIAVCLIAGAASGVVGVSVALVLGTAAQLCFLLFWLPKEKYRYQFSVRFNTPEIRNDIKLLIPALIGGGLADIKAWIDILIATHLSIGSPAAINFSARLIGFVNGLIIIPIVGMAYAYMSEHAAKNDIKKMLDTLWQTVRVILFIVTPIVVIAMPSSFDIVHIVYQRGGFTPEATILTGTALMGFLPGLLGMTIHIFLIRFFYALQDTKTPMICGAIAIIINIALSLLLSSIMGIGGLALATSVSTILTAILLLIFLRRKLGPLGFSQTAVNTLKTAACAVPCALAALAATHALSAQNVIIRFGATTIAGGIAYLATAFLIKEIVLRDFIQKYIRDRLAKKR